MTGFEPSQYTYLAAPIPELLRASVRHTDAFPKSARLVRVSCLECVFRVQRRRSRATQFRQMVTIDRWFLSVCHPKPNSAGVRIAQRTRFCRAPNLITIWEAIPPPSICKVEQDGRPPRRWRLPPDKKLTGRPSGRVAWSGRRRSPPASRVSSTSGLRKVALNK
jgi:hypothetical protein